MTTEHPSQDRLGQTPGTLITDDDHMLAHNVDEEPVEAPTYMTATGASQPNPDAEEHYLVDMVCDPASLPGPIRRALMLQGKT